MLFLGGTPDVLYGTGLSSGHALRLYVDNRVKRWALPVLDDDDVWRHPLVESAADTLPAIHHRLVPAFVAGMAAQGVDAKPANVAYGYVGSLVARAALTSMPLEMLGAPPSEDLGVLFRQRAELTRFLADLGLALIEGSDSSSRSSPAGGGHPPVGAG